MAVPVAALQEINPGSVIELFELELNIVQHGVNETSRFHAGVDQNTLGIILTEESSFLLYEDGTDIATEIGDVVWNGLSYQRFPVFAEGFEFSGVGQLPRPRMRFSNLLGTFTGLILSLPRGIEGAKITRIRTLVRYLDAVNFPGNVNPYGTPDPTAEFPREVYYIDRKSTESRDIVEFELASVFDLAGVRAPKRQCISSFCQWVYRDSETCQYTGTAFFNEDDEPVATAGEDICGKRLSSCELRFAQVNGTGTVTSGSNQLALDLAVATEAGQPIKGFGVASGTTVSSISGSTITMSANATASSTKTTTGTLQSNRTEIVVASAAGLAVGMEISGSNVTAGTTIAEISGTTITLSQPAPWLAIATEEASIVNGTLSNRRYGYNANPRDPDPVGEFVILSTLAGVDSGQYVIGPTIAESDNAQVLLKVGNSGATKYALLNFKGAINGSTGTYKFYTVPVQGSITYTFTAPDRNYSFRTNGIINFGAFPGVNTYLT